MHLLTPRNLFLIFVNTFVTMVFIFFIKKLADKYNIPVVKTVADAV